MRRSSLLTLLFLIIAPDVGHTCSGASPALLLPPLPEPVCPCLLVGEACSSELLCGLPGQTLTTYHKWNCRRELWATVSGDGLQVSPQAGRAPTCALHIPQELAAGSGWRQARARCHQRWCQQVYCSSTAELEAIAVAHDSISWCFGLKLAEGAGVSFIELASPTGHAGAAAARRRRHSWHPLTERPGAVRRAHHIRRIDCGVSPARWAPALEEARHPDRFALLRSTQCFLRG